MVIYFIRLLFLPVLLAITPFLACNKNDNLDHKKAKRVVPARIISFAPSITETVFAIGAGDRLVGCTRYCTYPVETKSIQKIGDYYDPHYESILRLKPDFAIIMEEHTQVIDFLSKNSIKYLVVGNNTIAKIFETITQIGNICGSEKRAAKLRDSIQNELRITQNRSPAIKGVKPKVLICIGRQEIGTGTISKIWAAGPATFYSELIETASGKNVISDSLLEYPVLSTEGIIRLKPDVIIDVMAIMYEISCKKVVEDWKKLDMIPAVQNNMVFSLSGEYVNVPGPRIILLYRDIKEVIEKYYKNG